MNWKRIRNEEIISAATYRERLLAKQRKVARLQLAFEIAIIATAIGTVYAVAIWLGTRYFQ